MNTLRREEIVAALLPTIRQRHRGAYIVADTSHWADWRDDDAIRCHGYLPPFGDTDRDTDRETANVMVDAYVVSGEVLGELPEDFDPTDYNSMFTLLVSSGVGTLAAAQAAA